MNVQQCHISGITKKKNGKEVKAKWRTCPVGGLARSPLQFFESSLLRHVSARAGSNYVIVIEIVIDYANMM